MTADLFDLGMRLRAHATGRAQPRVVHTPYAAYDDAVAVLCDGGTWHVAGRGGPSGSGEAGDVLALLMSYTPGKRPADDAPVTLVVPDRATLHRLHRIAVDSDPWGPSDDAARLVAWWQERSEHADSHATLTLDEACRHRWVTGEPPAQERTLATWARWLGVRLDGPRDLLALADVVCDPWLTHPAVARQLAAKRRPDSFAWSRLRFNAANGVPWRRPDSPLSAARAFRDREGAVQRWQAWLLADPAGRERERHTGRVVTGRIERLAVQMVVRADESLCRHKPGQLVRVTILGTADPDDSESDDDSYRCRLAGLDVAEDGATLLTVERDTRSERQFGLVGPGDRVRITPEPFAGGWGGANIVKRARHGVPPLASTPVTRDVPLQIVAAAADDAE